MLDFHLENGIDVTTASTKLCIHEYEWGVHANGESAGTRWVDTLNHDEGRILWRKWHPHARHSMLIAASTAASGILQCHQIKDIWLAVLSASLSQRYPMQKPTNNTSSPRAMSSRYCHGTAVAKGGSRVPKTVLLSHALERGPNAPTPAFW